MSGKAVRSEVLHLANINPSAGEHRLLPLTQTSSTSFIYR
jgi:hypothetical protein